tara:strand:+ start:12627 stop:13574 length:948 start_codon:yes stop_codon:yes gene_type:complete
MIFEKNQILEDLPSLEEYMNKAKSIDYYSNKFLDLNQNIEELKSELRKIKNLQTKLKEYPNILENSLLSLFQSKVKLSYRGRKLIISYPYIKKFEIEYSPFSEKSFSFNIVSPDDFSSLDLFNEIYNNFLKDTKLYKNEEIFKSFLDSLKYIELCKEKIKDLIEEYHLNINLLRNKEKYNINKIQQTLKKNTFKTVEDFIFSRKDQIQDKTYEEHFYTYKLDFQHLRFIKYTLQFHRDKETQKIVYKIKDDFKNKLTNAKILKILNNSVKIVGKVDLKGANSLSRIGIKINSNGRISYEDFFNSKINLIHNAEYF